MVVAVNFSLWGAIIVFDASLTNYQDVGNEFSLQPNNQPCSMRPGSKARLPAMSRPPMYRPSM